MKFKVDLSQVEKLEKQTRFTLPPHGPVVFCRYIA